MTIYTFCGVRVTECLTKKKYIKYYTYIRNLVRVGATYLCYDIMTI